ADTACDCGDVCFLVSRQNFDVDSARAYRVDRKLRVWPQRVGERKFADQGSVLAEGDAFAGLVESLNPSFATQPIDVARYSPCNAKAWILDKVVNTGKLTGMFQCCDRLRHGVAGARPERDGGAKTAF